MASRGSPAQGDENCADQNKSQTSDKIIARIADRVYPEHLRRFATTLLGIQDAKFSQITHGQEKLGQLLPGKVSHIFCY